MDKRQIVEETIAYLGAEQRRVDRKLEKKKREYEKLEASFSELPSTPFWERIFRRKLKSLMSRKECNLEEETSVLSERVNQFTQAIADLEKGMYNTAIPLLNQRTDLKKQLISFQRSQSIKKPQNRV